MDFSKSQYTAIVSDLHLCEEEPVHPKFPLWKKYKTRQFFFDDDFVGFLKNIEQKANGHRIELILNGDIFDFDSVTGLPEDPPYKISTLEENRGLHPQEEKSEFKIERILGHHPVWVRAMKEFIARGHRAIFIIGNHDLELHFKRVQKVIFDALSDNPIDRKRIRFTEWFYISNGDTLIEHGNQYDPYCVCQDPINPFVQKFNQIEVRVPFGNLTTRYLVNGMGFFNPHLDSNYIMTPGQYVRFFLKYMGRAQPLLVIDWLTGATLALTQAFTDRLKPKITDPLTIEDRIEEIASKANATPRMVRELRELFVAPAASNPILLMKELWLDRSLILLLAIFTLYLIFLQINNIFDISVWWLFIPFAAFVPFFLFYARSVSSSVGAFKEPQEKILSLSGLITKVSRIVYGHTHIVRHEIVGPIEHLNSGTWSPAFLDVECEKPVGQKTYIWIEPATEKGPNGEPIRDARVFQFKNGQDFEVFATGGRADRQHMG
jgi:UDP-2,3-diacylglucosamine pyrophosphatase LpxH